MSVLAPTSRLTPPTIMGETTGPAIPPIYWLPDELLEIIVSYLPPPDTIALGATSKRSNKITRGPLVWRRHCVQTWRHWNPRHALQGRLDSPPTHTKWHHLFHERRKMDRDVQELFNEMLLTQQKRYARMETIADHGYDVKDLIMSIRDTTPDDAEDVLARRYHADRVLGQLHRAEAIDKWRRVANRQMVRLEEVLGAYDLFVLNGKNGDLRDIDREFDRLAEGIKARDEDWEELTIRRKAVQVSKYLRSEGLVGNPSEDDYHALRNNFISIALFNEPHTSLPLQSVAIYCAVARRLGINAKPSNYPQHVHAVIEAPPDRTLDGKYKTAIQGAAPELMHLDPWRSSDEIPHEHLALRLLQMGAPEHQHAQHLGPTSTMEVALRTSRNIMNSVHQARERHRGPTRRGSYPDVEASWYAMVWSMLVLGDSNSASSLHRRRQCLPYLIQQFQAHFPEDMGLIEKEIVPIFRGEREHDVMLELIERNRIDDRNAKAPSPRSNLTSAVKYKIGHHFRHKRYDYEGFIIGWDLKCEADAQWIQQMRVDSLPNGRNQPFYNVVAEDESVRYVAAENIEVVEEEPSQSLMKMAGKYFKRWDGERKVFVSNVRDEYPDD
ncbi:F-box only protein 21 [Fulvia fulva]|uniref:F-box only protein 21 n=1 Tax=Passalora fulva TaxID=5499 RepID=A0A9Q8PK84_PASFU|nr:F-box only protein 21 [Fulvia fulva]KAK4611964.1 F-box only protein 21 [Fulvia fulva]KAK4612926.1 F-box only protein 21 [Fulvia fulva]UJO23983.1 F-box only protein 21 [Fulvia fulva]WPV20961.1 F-box only protein 21 [Fulvia fulva]WPV35796.1 F-box only protein 21 [Fulvia fulva]